MWQCQCEKCVGCMLGDTILRCSLKNTLNSNFKVGNVFMLLHVVETGSYFHVVKTRNLYSQTGPLLLFLLSVNIDWLGTTWIEQVFFFFLVGAIRMCFTKYFKSWFCQNTTNFIVNRKCGYMFRLSNHQANSWTIFTVHWVKVHIFGISKCLQLRHNVGANKVGNTTLICKLQIIHEFS